jgi:geranylgeranyl diphosphate synthase type II
MHTFNDLKAILDKSLHQAEFPAEPNQLYDPLRYILGIGGKRIRPLLALMSCDLFNEDPKKALGAAMAVEYFHNFSLIHDDIMDQADVRRGQETVHKKWNVNVGILSGDALLIKAYQQLDTYPADLFKPLNQLLCKTAIEVCEGQQFDVDFETLNEVSKEDYIEMIRLKTAVLLGASLKMGAFIAKASEKDAELIYNFGIDLGIAFQLQDDYLDSFGDAEHFGKRIGGDIINNKKTILFIEALKRCNSNLREQLLNLYQLKDDSQQKIEEVKSIFDDSGAKTETLSLIEHYTNRAYDSLDQIAIDSQNKQELNSLAHYLMNRSI